jgi:hypothetical protein
MSEIARKGGVRSMEIVKPLKRVKRRGRHAPLPRKAVEPVRYVSVRLLRPIFERLVPAKSNQGRNDHDYNQQSSHDHRELTESPGEINGIRYIVPPSLRLRRDR